jgi:hypothetical protein
MVVFVDMDDDLFHLHDLDVDLHIDVDDILNVVYCGGVQLRNVYESRTAGGGWME